VMDFGHVDGEIGVSDGFVGMWVPIDDDMKHQHHAAHGESEASKPMPI